MNLNDEKLRSDLQALHAELQQTASVQSEQRELLETLSTDIRRLLNQPPSEALPDSGFSEKLNDAVAHLEASHPRVTLLIRQVIDSLSYLGI